MRERKLTLALAAVLALLVAGGALFVLGTVRGQTAARDTVSAREFAAYEAEYGLASPEAAQTVLDTFPAGGALTGETALALLAGALPGDAALVSAGQEEGVLTIDYLRREDGVYNGRVVLSYDREGLRSVSVRGEGRIVTVDRDGARETVRLS